MNRQSTRFSKQISHFFPQIIFYTMIQLGVKNKNKEQRLPPCTNLCWPSTSVKLSFLAGVPISKWASSSRKILSSKSPTDSTYSSYSLLTDLLMTKQYYYINHVSYELDILWSFMFSKQTTDFHQPLSSLKAMYFRKTKILTSSVQNCPDQECLSSSLHFP